MAARRLLDGGRSAGTSSQAQGDDAANVQWDRIDARAMLAIEVDREWRYRLDPDEYRRNPGTPADRVELWGDQGLRLEVEAMCGEPLL